MERTCSPTPSAVGMPVIHAFTADRTDIVAGETVALRWDLSGADAAFLRYNGVEEGVVSPGEKILSPVETTTFTLLARSAEQLAQAFKEEGGAKPQPAGSVY